MADLKKRFRIVDEDELKPAIIQLESFINKVRTDISKGNIPEPAGKNLINEANNLIARIKI